MTVELKGLPNARAKRGPWSTPCAAHDCRACEIRGLTFCAGLDASEVATLSSISRRMHFAKRHIIFQEGDTADVVYNVTKGAVRLFKLTPDGRRQVTGFLLPGDFLGLGSRQGYAYGAEAITEVELCRFERDKLEILFESHRGLERRLFEIANDELAVAQDQMLLLGRKTAKERMASFLLKLSEREELRGGRDRAVYLPMVQEDIADYLGLTIETVSRTISQLKRDGLIRQSSTHEFELLSTEGLEDISEPM